MRDMWKSAKLATLSEINYGYTESASATPIGPRFLRITDLQDDGVNWQRVPYCPIEKARIAKFRLAHDDIVFARTGATTGKSHLVQHPPEAVFASYLIRLRLRAEELSPQFLNFFFQSEDYWQAIETGSTGSAQGGFNASKLGALSIRFPSLPEQQRIVAILDEAFEGIATAKANAEKNLRNARGLFDSELFELLKKDGSTWPQKTLRQVAIDFGRGKSKHRPRNDPKLYGGTYPFIQTGDVRNSEHLITEYTQSYSEAGLAQSKLWPKGTLCITIAANIAETGILDFEACFPDSVIGVVVDPAQTTGKYVEYMLQTVKAELKAKGKGSAQDNINLATFENERFPFPHLHIQADLVRQLDELSVHVQRLEDIYLSKLSALEELKKSLLHQAFNGKL